MIRTSRSVGRRREPPGFTLLELLVVIGVIAVLVALLFPALRSVRAQGKSLTCQNNERQLWQGFLMFAAEHEQRLPGNQNDTAPGTTDPSHVDFLRGLGGDWTKAPQAGTLFPYVGRNANLFLCPARDPAPMRGGTQILRDDTSNGRFDYAAFLGFAGAKLADLPAQSRLTYPNGKQEMLPTPIIVEEGPPTINASNFEGGHSNADQMAHVHNHGSYYVAPDGACHWINEPADVNANNWSAVAPSGRWTNIGGSGYGPWGWWGHQ